MLLDICRPNAARGCAARTAPPGSRRARWLTNALAPLALLGCSLLIGGCSTSVPTELPIFKPDGGVISEEQLQAMSQSGDLELELEADEIRAANGICIVMATCEPRSTEAASQYDGLITISAIPTSDPVSTFFGELYGYDDRADLYLGGPAHLGLVRYYSSFGQFAYITGISALGTNWMHNFDARLQIVSSGPFTSANLVLFHFGNISFGLNGVLGFQIFHPTDLRYQLVAINGGYQFMSPMTNLIYTFDSSGNLLSIADRNGNTATVTRTAGSPGPTQVSDGLGRTITLSYTGSNLTKATDQSGRFVTYEYSGGNLSAFTDANGKRTTYSYTSVSGYNTLLTSVTRPAGNKPLSQTYVSSGAFTGAVASQSDSFGNTMTMGWPANTPPFGATITGPLGVTQTQVDGNTWEDLLSVTDASGASSMYTWDSNDHKINAADKLGHSTSATYDPASGLPTSTTDQLGNTTTYTYTSTVQGPFTFYDPAGIQFPDGTSISIVRDAKGNILSFTDQAGQKWQTTRNSRGQILTFTNPTGAVTTYTYGPDGTRTSVKLDSGDTTTYSYDPISRPITITEADGNAVHLQYDAVSNFTKFTDERGDNTSAAYDGNNNLAGTTDALAASTVTVYDTNDNPVSYTDRAGKTSTLAYDALQRRQKIANAAGNAVTYAYDTLNRATSAVDATGKGDTYGWDKENRLTSVTDALGRAFQLVRDARGGITQLTTPNSEKYSRVLDKLGRVTSATDALNRSAQFTYDPLGALTGETLPGGVTASFSRNALDLITAVTDPDGNVWARGFDKMGRRISRTDPLGRITSCQYNSRQRVSSATSPLGNAQYTYDAASNRTGATYSDGTLLSYIYDADNRLTGGAGVALGLDANGLVNLSNGVGATHDAANRLASITYAPGKTVTYTYDLRGLLFQVADWLGGITAFTYDAARQLTSIVFPNGVREDYTYDPDGRRSTIQVTANGNVISSIALQRDAIGRVTSASRSALNLPVAVPPNASPTYDAAEQSAAATYDAMGRVTADAARSYTWDLASRLTSYKGTDGAGSFTYDALGMRISGSAGGAGGAAQNYVWDYATALPTVAVVQSAGADQRYYIWLPSGMLLAAIDAGTGKRHFYHFNESGSTDFLTDDSGAVTDSYAITPYGEVVAQSGSTPNPFTFQGAWGVMQEGATGLYYMRRRYYDSRSARFLSVDPSPSLDARAIDPYQFAFANPVEHADPTGAKVVPVSSPQSVLGLQPTAVPASPLLWNATAATQPSIPAPTAYGLGATQSTKSLALYTAPFAYSDLNTHVPGAESPPRMIKYLGYDFVQFLPLESGSPLDFFLFLGVDSPPDIVRIVGDKRDTTWVF
ncbi:hypothetical protein SBA4_5580015 [Candidatus Sulfopaludibacter sp. SbA4]|nr:hypothetical protein SBA4_5580015 [Candidatus Sulfopaludibacter sp. SbA4]